MSEILRLDASDRLLVLAPHPDDEAIACGGLLLAAHAIGAVRRVVVVTDGDNNPWPQRWIERRWRIDAKARARWGARRRAEAHAALDVLAVEPELRFFLGLPDTGLTDLLMTHAQGLPERLREQIEEFRPSLIALPALEDRHPDHSAVHIALRIALLHSAATPRCLIYRVHGDSTGPFEIDAAWRDQKRRAIARHATQMRLSRKRFLAYAEAPEAYAPMPARSQPRIDHPLRAHFRSPRELELRIRAGSLRGRSGHLQLVLLFEGADQHLRWRLPLALAGESVALTDLLSGRRLQNCHWRHADGDWFASIEVAWNHLPRLGYAKLAGKHPALLVFDRFGWQIVEEPPARFSQGVLAGVG